MLAAPLPGQPLIHDHWSMNAFLETRRDDDVSGLDAIAAAKVTRTLRTARQCMAPIEGRGVLAEWDPRLEQMIVTTSTQMPHVTKTGLADCLGLDEGQVRIVSPDVGGGFGYKGILLPEEIVCASIAQAAGRPVRWLEDRFEQLTARQLPRASLRHHRLGRPRRQAAGRGRAKPPSMPAPTRPIRFGACLEAAQVGSILPGPYDTAASPLPHHLGRTNKPPILPYRGVARTGVCYAWNSRSTPSRASSALKPHAIRLANLVPPRRDAVSQPRGKVVRQRRLPRSAAPRGRRLRSRLRSAPQPGRGRRPALGFGFAIFCEQGGARHVGLSRLGHSLRAGLRAGLCRALQPRRRAGTARRRAQPRPGPGDDAGAGRARDPGRASRTRFAWSTATPRSRPIRRAPGAVALHGDGGRRRGRGLPRSWPSASPRSARHCCRSQAGDVEIADGKVRRGHRSELRRASPTSRAPGIARRRTCRPVSTKGGLEVTAGYRPIRDTGTLPMPATPAVVAGRHRDRRRRSSRTMRSSRMAARWSTP